MPAPEFHGEDGLGNFDEAQYGIDQIPMRVEKEHAVNAIISAALKYGNELIVLALAPLTNLAIAVRLNQTAMTSIGKLVIMGGAETAVGNTSRWAEYNFRCDPEAAHIVLETFPPKIVYLATWPLTLKYELPPETIGNKETVIGRFLRETWKVALMCGSGRLRMADPIAAFVACFPKKVQSKQMKIRIVLQGEKLGASEVEEVEENGINLVTEIDLECFKEVLVRLMEHH
jgi:purine nucleosidase